MRAARFVSRAMKREIKRGLNQVRGAEMNKITKISDFNGKLLAFCVKFG